MKIAYLGQFDVASDSPARQRVIGIAQSLSEAGHEVRVHGAGEALSDVELAPGIVGRSYPSPVESLDSGRVPDLVISYGGDIFHTTALQKWAAERGVPRVIDSAEWYDRRHIAGGCLGPRALQNEYCMRRAYPRYGRAVVISSYLRRYFQSKGCAAIQVPPTLDVRGLRRPGSLGGARLQLVYAGTPGKKDLLREVIAGVLDVDPAGNLARLDIIGIDESSLRLALKIDISKHPGITAHGRLARDAAIEHVARADFVPLLRPNARFAHAGFPTKVAEAMAFGTPVIANLTSDLDKVVSDGDTGLVVSAPTGAAFSQALRRALMMSDEDRAAMRDRAWQRASEYFDFRNYASELDDYVREAIDSR